MKDRIPDYFRYKTPPTPTPSGLYGNSRAMHHPSEIYFRFLHILLTLGHKVKRRYAYKMTLWGGVGGNSLTTSPAYFHGVNAVTGAGDQLRPDVSEDSGQPQASSSLDHCEPDWEHPQSWRLMI